MIALALTLLFAAPQDDREGVRTVHEAVNRSFVGIEIRLRKKSRIERAEMEQEALDTQATQFIRLMDNGQPFETWGVAVDKDLVLMPDHGLRARDVSGIRMTDARGAQFTGRFHALGRSHDFVLVKVDAPHPLTPITFTEWQAPKLGEYFYVTYADRVDTRWHLNVSPYILTNEPLVASKEWFCIDMLRPGSVISRTDGKTVGIALDQYLWARPDGRSSFLGPAMLSDERVTDLEERTNAFTPGLGKSVKRLEITFRSEQPQSRYAPPPPGGANRATLFGVTLDDKGTLLVPTALTRDQIRKIEDLRVVDRGRAYATEFVGAFRAFEALLVRAKDLKTESGLDRKGAAPPPGELFFTATVEDRFGRNRVKFKTNRLFRIESGLEGAPRRRAHRRIKNGSFLLDFEGGIVGVATYDKKPEDLDDVAAGGAPERYYMSRLRRNYRADYLRRLLFASEIADVLKDPTPHFDPSAVPMTKKDEKRLVWLGIEYQGMSKPIAEALGVEERDLTNDGRRGLVVTELYAGSPAARAGIAVGDILLAVTPSGESPRDLVAARERYPFGMRPPRGQVPALWKPRQNYLTRLLTEVGAEKKIDLAVLRGKKKSTKRIVLEVAPRDFETANSLKDENLGVTLKDLTYEVRHFHKVPVGMPGVVVSKIESGSRAQVAKLEALSIITRVNDVPVANVSEFKKLLSIEGNLTLTTISYGQTKLVELERE